MGIPHFFAIAVIALGGFISVTDLVAKDEFRTWGDAKGKNKIKAKFVKLEDDVVTLEKEDGDEVEIELKKLSPADQKFAADASKESEDSPFKTKTDDPFKKVKPKAEKKNSNEPKETDGDQQSGDVRAIKVKMNNVKQIKLASQAKGWRVEIPESENQAASDEPDPVSLPAKSDFFEKMNGLVIGYGESAKTAIVSYCLEKGGKEAITRIIRCDLKAGTSEDPAEATGQFVPLALHEDGRQILARSTEFGWGKNDRLEIWVVKGDKVARTFTWTPYDFEKGGARDVVWAEFLDGDRLATCNSQGRVIFWKFPSISPLSSFEATAGAIPALSADRKLLAYSVGNAIGVFDTTRQKVLAQQAVSPSPVSINLSFSPSSTRLAGVTVDKLLVWDVVSGKLEQTIACDGVGLGGHVNFLDESFVLVGNSILIDIQNDLKLWTYQGAEQVRSANGLAFFALTNGTDKNGALIPALLPHAAARDMRQKALSDSNDFALKAGTEVRIDVSGVPDAAQRERVTKGLTKQLDAIQCKVAPKGTIDLIATVQGPKEVEVSFMRAGDHKFKEYRTTVRFVYENRPAWESTGTNTPGVISLKAGENIEGHLRSLEKPIYEFFERVSLPKLILKPAAGQGPSHSLTLGVSQITSSGIP